MKVLLAAVALGAALIPLGAMATAPSVPTATAPAANPPRSLLVASGGWAAMLLGMGLLGAMARRDDDLA